MWCWSTCRFPVTTLPIPFKHVLDVGKTKFPVTIAQIAVAGFKHKQKVPKDYLKWFMAPGAFCERDSQVHTLSVSPDPKCTPL